MYYGNARTIRQCISCFNSTQVQTILKKCALLQLCIYCRTVSFCRARFRQEFPGARRGIFNFISYTMQLRHFVFIIILRRMERTNCFLRSNTVFCTVQYSIPYTNSALAGKNRGWEICDMVFFELERPTFNMPT